MHFLFFIWRHKCIHTEREREREGEREREREGPEGFLWFWARVSVKPTGQTLTKPSRAKILRKSFQYKTCLDFVILCWNILWLKFPRLNHIHQKKKVVFHYDVHELNTGGYIYYSATGRRCLHYYNLTSLCWLSQSVWQTRVSKRACKSVKCTCLGKFPMPPYSKKKQFTRPKSVKIIINNNHVVHYMPFWITYKTCNNTLD